MKVVLVGYYGAGNIGDELLLYGSIKILKEAWSILDEDICILSQDPHQTKEDYPRCESVNKFHIFDVLRVLWVADSVIYGGGSIFQDVSSFRSLVYYALICFISKVFCKKVILLGQGIGPFRSRMSEIIAKWCFRISDLLIVRDQTQNQPICDRWELKGVHYASDMVWSVSVADYISQTPIEDKELQGVVISLRPHSDLGDQAIENLANFFNQTYSKKRIYLLAMQRRDIEILLILKEKLIHQDTSVLFFKTVRELLQSIDLFSKVEAAYCMRYHAVLISQLLEIPVVGISYDPKVQGLCLESNVPNITIKNLMHIDQCKPAIDAMKIDIHKHSIKKYIELLKKLCK